MFRNSDGRCVMLDWLLIILSLAGLFMIVDTCALERSAGDGNIFGRAIKQALCCLALFVVYQLCSGRFRKLEHLKALKKWTPVFLFAACAVLLAVVFFGAEVNGAVRWMRFAGQSIQPSEIFKPLYALGVAWYVTEQKNCLPTLNYLVLMLLFGIFAAVGISNMSTGIQYGFVLIIGLWIGGMENKYLIMLGVAGVILGAAVVLCGDEFRQMRIAAWLDPVAYASQEGNQVVISLASISSAGLIGCGYGNGLAKYIIPEPCNDYIFTTIAEEFGCIGCIVVAALYGMLFYTAGRIISESRNRYCRILCFCCMGFILFQALLNISVTLNMLPSTGVCLPFISYGVSSLTGCYALVFLMQLASMSRDEAPKALKIHFKKRNGPPELRRSMSAADMYKRNVRNGR